MKIAVISQETFLKKTPLLNFNDPTIIDLISKQGWKNLSTHEKIGAAYNFIKSNIKFGYNSKDTLSASKILQDGFGQCNTKAILFMALLRGLSVACRFHGFTIDKKLQRGIVPELFYSIAPKNIIHSWVEVYYKNKWVNLEGFIIDDELLHALQKKFTHKKQLTGYGIGTKCLSNPQVEWTGESTYIQKEGINQDFGIYDDPDTFYRIHDKNLNWFQQFIFALIVQKLMNRKVNRLRQAQ